MTITSINRIRSAINNCQYVYINTFLNNRFVRISKAEAIAFIESAKDDISAYYDGSVLRIGA